jgi:hypothetical protein
MPGAGAVVIPKCPLVQKPGKIARAKVNQRRFVEGVPLDTDTSYVSVASSCLAGMEALEPERKLRSRRFY